MTIRASPALASEQEAVLTRWQLAIDLANEFLASSFNRSLPSKALLHLDSDGMRLVTADRTMPIKLVLIDEYRSSSCVCATVDTHKNVVYIRRPWGASFDLPIATCNTFFESGFSGVDEPVFALATLVLRFATILFYEKHAHISSWEWFKCQRLEWLIGSGHHKFSMRRPNAVAKEFFYFWSGMEPATPCLKRILARAPDAAANMAERRRGRAAWRREFEQYLQERRASEGSSAGR